MELRYLARINDSDSGEILFEKRYKIRSAATRFVSNQFTLSMMGMCIGRNIEGFVRDLHADRVIYSKTPNR